MKISHPLFATAASVALLLVSPAHPWKARLIWNRTESAPLGLYWRTGALPARNGWAVISADAPASIWVSSHGYLAPDWPIIKRVRGVRGDEICRVGTQILINGGDAATALETDSEGEKLPRWEGCIRLAEDEIFLLNDHPRSLDGRYFGATKLGDLDGSAVLLWRQAR